MNEGEKDLQDDPAQTKYLTEDKRSEMAFALLSLLEK